MKTSIKLNRKDISRSKSVPFESLENVSRAPLFKKDKPLSPFISKLRLLLKDSRYHSAIHWSKDGKAIVVSNPDIFKALVLDNVDEMFKTRNFTSFVRQLNLYGFRKIPTIGRSDPMKNMHFEHQHFRRDRPDFMHLVHRTCISSKKKSIEASPEIISPRERDFERHYDSSPQSEFFLAKGNVQRELKFVKDDSLDLSDESTSQDHDYALPNRNGGDDYGNIEHFDPQLTFDYFNKIFENEEVAIQGLLNLKFGGFCSVPS